VTEIPAKPKRGIVKRISNVISNLHLLVGLSEMMINVEKLKNASKVYFDFQYSIKKAILGTAQAI
jgi:hypothetical protein